MLVPVTILIQVAVESSTSCEVILMGTMSGAVYLKSANEEIKKAYFAFSQMWSVKAIDRPVLEEFFLLFREKPLPTSRRRKYLNHQPSKILSVWLVPRNQV